MLKPSILLSIIALAVVAARVASGATTPLVPHDQVVHEVYGFLVSDVGTNGILTEDNDPLGDPVPPYFYHYAIWHTNNLESSLVGYPGYASISYPGYTMSIAIDAFLAYWAYSGNPQALARARQAADWLLPRRTPAADTYGNWVYSTQTDGVMGGGFDGEAIMSDKSGMFGRRLLRLFDATGEIAYFNTAVEIADTYVATQLTGGVEDDGRWPYRVRPADGLVIQDYTSHLIPATRLLEELELRLPGNGYGLAAQRAWDWLLNNPLEPTSADYMHWEGFYEDIGTASVGLHDHYGAESTLAELVLRNQPGDLDLAIDILNWSTNRYLAPNGLMDGGGLYAPALLEWDAWLNSTYAATGQWGYVNLLLDRATEGTPLHDPSWRTDGLQALHNLTYGQEVPPPGDDGRMLTTIRELIEPSFGRETWYEQNFNTLIYLLWSMPLAPELAPNDESHLIGFTGGELQAIDYQTVRINTRWSGAGVATFKLSQIPVSVRLGSQWHAIPQAGVWSWDAATSVLVVEHAGGEVEIALGGLTTTDIPSQVAQWSAPYPNPFNPRITFEVSLKRASDVDVSIFDARGRLVRRLARNELSPGTHQIVWNGATPTGVEVASGVYRVVLSAGDGRETRTISLVR